MSGKLSTSMKMEASAVPASTPKASRHANAARLEKCDVLMVQEVPSASVYWQDYAQDVDTPAAACRVIGT